MGSKVAAWLSAWVGLSVVSGCGKAEGGAEPIALSELPTKVADLLCNGLAGCCKSRGFAMDVAGCKTFNTVGLQSDYSKIDLQRMRYDAQAAGDCLRELSAKMQCGQVGGDTPAVCQRVFVGRSTLGQPCNYDDECAAVAGRYVFCGGTVDAQTPSICTAISNATYPHGQAGDACSATCQDGDTCEIGAAPAPQPGAGDPPAPGPQAASIGCYRADGLFCDVGLCAPLLEPGAPCSDSQACRGSAFCNFDTGLCTAPQPEGSPCHGGQECQSEFCTAVPGELTASGLPALACSLTATITAQQCERDYSSSATDADETDPGASPGSP